MWIQIIFRFKLTLCFDATWDVMDHVMIRLRKRITETILWTGSLKWTVRKERVKYRKPRFSVVRRSCFLGSVVKHKCSCFYSNTDGIITMSVITKQKKVLYELRTLQLKLLCGSLNFFPDYILSNIYLMVLFCLNTFISTKADLDVIQATLWWNYANLVVLWFLLAPILI